MAGLLALAAGLSGCSHATPTSTPQPTASPFPATATLAPARPTHAPTVMATAAPTSIPPTPVTGDGLSLPETFRYEVTMRPVGESSASQTVVTGQYRAGNWAQVARRGADLAGGSLAEGEELTVVGGASYTRPAGETTWTRWPGVGFDAAFGLASPFTVLRLYPLADAQTKGVLEPVPGAPEATFRTQAVISADTVQRVLRAGIARLAPDAQSQAALATQVAPLAVQQTITYWADASSRVYRAAATLLAADEAGQPAPWLEITWRFWGYDDPTVAIVPPTNLRDAPGPVTTSQPRPTVLPTQTAATGANLIVRVFSSPGVPAKDLAVTVYPAGGAHQPLDWRSEANAQFALPPGSYDVLVQMDYAQEWLRGIEVTAGSVVTREVVFDFGNLELTVTQNGATIPVDIVTYPTGDRQNWVDWRSDNPARILLRAGTYDVEIAYADYSKTKTVTGLIVRAGETTQETVELKP